MTSKQASLRYTKTDVVLHEKGYAVIDSADYFGHGPACSRRVKAHAGTQSHDVLVSTHFIYQPLFNANDPISRHGLSGGRRGGYVDVDFGFPTTTKKTASEQKESQCYQNHKNHQYSHHPCAPATIVSHISSSLSIRAVIKCLNPAEHRKPDAMVDFQTSRGRSLKGKTSFRRTIF
jgi:hypothetical protein